MEQMTNEMLYVEIRENTQTRSRFIGSNEKKMQWCHRFE